MRKMMFLFLTAALALATAASNNFKLTLTSATWVGDTKLEAGNYKIEVDGNKAIIREGKKTVAEVPAMMEHNKTKYNLTSLGISNAVAEKPMLEEVRVGGTDTKIVIEKK